MQYLEHYLTRELNREGHTTHFLSSDQMNPVWKPFLKHPEAFRPGVFEEEGYRIFRVKSKMVGQKVLPWDRQALRTYLQQDYDVIHLSGIPGFFNFMVLGLLKKYQAQTPVFINDHSNPKLVSRSLSGRAYYKINSLVFERFKKRVTGVIAPNQGTYDLLAKRYGLGPQQLEIIPLGYDDRIFNYRPELKNKKEQFVIGFAGKLEARKKIEVLLEALRELPFKEQVEVIVVGQSQEDEYSQMLHRLAREAGINFTLKALIRNPEELAAFYNYLDLAVFPGSISITTIEATGCGTPVLVNNSIPGLEDRVDQGRGALFSTPTELKTLLTQYFQQDSDHSTIAQNTARYSWKAISQRYLDKYEVAIKNQSYAQTNH